jgi:hypothetical protein
VNGNISTPDFEWQRLWFATRAKAWSSLAIIPSDPGVDAHRVAEALVKTGRVHGERAVELLNAQGAQLASVHHLVDKLGQMTARGEWVVVPVDSITENPNAIPMVRAASAALLVVRLGESLLDASRAAIDVVGRDHFIGSVVLGPERDGGDLLRISI